MNTFLAVILALTIGSDLREPASLYQDSGTLVPNKDIRPFPSFYVKRDVPVKLEAKGDGRGDLDCYLLKYSGTEHGWVIAGKDESNMDQCTIAYTPTLVQPIRLWVVNHGVHPTTYTVSVKQ